MNSISGTPTLLLFDLHSQSPRTGLSCGNLPGDKSSSYQWTQNFSISYSHWVALLFQSNSTSSKAKFQSSWLYFCSQILSCYYQDPVTRTCNVQEFKVTLFWLLCTPFFSFCWASTDTRALPRHLHALVTDSRTPCQLTSLSMCNTGSRSKKIQHTPTLQLTWVGGWLEIWISSSFLLHREHKVSLEPQGECQPGAQGSSSSGTGSNTYPKR